MREPGSAPRLTTPPQALLQLFAQRLGRPATGASKWNPIEHRLFSEISKHWAGQPLDSYPTILRLISQTTTQTGLRVSAALITKHYETGQKISDQQMRDIKLQKHATLPEWNYTIQPQKNRN